MTEQPNTNSLPPEVVEAIKKMGQEESAAAAISAVLMRMMSNECPWLDDGQRLDIIASALQFFRNIVLNEFLRVLTDGDKPYDLLTRHDDETLKHLQQAVGYSVVSLHKIRDKSTDRFFTLTEMVKGEAALDKAKQELVGEAKGWQQEAAT